jgi:HAMP domain-containing protein
MANSSSSHDTTSKRPPNGKHQTASKRTSNGKSTSEASLPARELLAALRSLRRGDFSVRLPELYGGIDGQIVATLNEIAQTADELERDAREAFVAVANEGRTKVRLKRAGLVGGWRRYADDANAALDRLTSHMRSMAAVANAVVHGDFSRRVDEQSEDGALAGEFLRHAHAINGMVDQLSSLSGEIWPTA